MATSLKASRRKIPYGTRSLTVIQDISKLDKLSPIFELFLKHIEPMMIASEPPTPLQHKHTIKDDTKHYKHVLGADRIDAKSIYFALLCFVRGPNKLIQSPAITKTAAMSFQACKDSPNIQAELKSPMTGTRSVKGATLPTG